MQATLNPNPTFKRFFVYMKAYRIGFLEGCRLFIRLNGCHLKDSFSGVVLIVVLMDNNNRLFLLTYMVVDSETKDFWKFFLHCLCEAIRANTKDKPFTFMSDRQRVILNTLMFIIKFLFNYF